MFLLIISMFGQTSLQGLIRKKKKKKKEICFFIC